MAFLLWNTTVDKLSFRSNFRLSLGEGFSLQMLLKMFLKMCGIPEESTKHFICHTLAMKATNYFLFLSLDTYPSHLFCQMNFQFSATCSQEKCSVSRKAFIQLSLGKPSLRRGFFSTELPAWENTFGHRVSVYCLEAFHFKHIWVFHWKVL